MEGVFVELPPFERHRHDYMDDEDYRIFQRELMKHPESGDLIQGTGGLRKIRFGKRRQNQGKRGGIRVIYYWWSGGSQFWLFTLYGKGETSDLTHDERKLLSQYLKTELAKRQTL